MTSSAKAMDTAVAIARLHVDRMIDGTRRPEINLTGLGRSCFDLLVQELAHCFSLVLDDESLAPETKARIRELVRAQEIYARATEPVQQHLDALAEGWTCRACPSKKASGAAVSGVRAGAIRVELICARCRTASPLTSAGKEWFRSIFRDVISPSWNPRANGFEWDER
jgi:hypothetical protein